MLKTNKRYERTTTIVLPSDFEEYQALKFRYIITLTQEMQSDYLLRLFLVIESPHTIKEIDTLIGKYKDAETALFNYYRVVKTHQRKVGINTK